MTQRDPITYLQNPKTKINLRHTRKRLELAYKLVFTESPKPPWSLREYLLQPETRVHCTHNRRKLERLLTQHCPKYLDYNGQPRWFPQRYWSTEERQFWLYFYAYKSLLTLGSEIQERKPFDCTYEEWVCDSDHEDWSAGYCGCDLPED
ncbi:MAG: hypothetical protein DSM106950_07340 [Stigonema ocellatum SAG 48.90 = DSM 106950]|nr:hypothetical protein [Stigonema ocellatum SAG 48.90 = DSM 106950]